MMLMMPTRRALGSGGSIALDAGALDAGALDAAALRAEVLRAEILDGVAARVSFTALRSPQF
jgi:hypothetical protein